MSIYFSVPHLTLMINHTFVSFYLTTIQAYRKKHIVINSVVENQLSSLEADQTYEKITVELRY